MLPAWFDLYPPAPERVIADDQRFAEFLLLQSEIAIGELRGVLAFVPTGETVNRFVEEAIDTLFTNDEQFAIQEEFRAVQGAGGRKALVNNLTAAGFDTLAAGGYQFTVDRYGRVRIAARDTASPSKFTQSHAMLFPGEDVLAAGWMEIRNVDSASVVHSVGAYSRTYFFSPFCATIRDDITSRSNDYLLTLGHLFSSLKNLGIATEGVLIRKF